MANKEKKASVRCARKYEPQERSQAGAAATHIDEFSEVQRASTFVPTDVIAAIAATTIKPAINAYSSTSPPSSSLASRTTRF